MTEDEIEQAAYELVMDAQVHALMAATAEHLLKTTPLWFLAMNDAHHVEAARLTDAGLLAAAAVFQGCDPVLDDGGAVCDRHNAPYPCKALREAHAGAGIWDEYVKGYPEGWEAWEDEWDTLGDCRKCGRPVRDSTKDWVNLADVDYSGDRALFHGKCKPGSGREAA